MFTVIIACHIFNGVISHIVIYTIVIYGGGGF